MVANTRKAVSYLAAVIVATIASKLSDAAVEVVAALAFIYCCLVQSL